MFNFIVIKNEYILVVEMDKFVDLFNVVFESDGWFMNRCIYIKNVLSNEIKNYIFNIREMIRIEKEVFIMGIL